MVYVKFNIPKDMILSQLQTHYGGDNSLSKICITGEFDGWEQRDENSVCVGENSKSGDAKIIKIVVELPEEMQKSEFKMVVDGYKWLTLDGFDICDNTNNLLDVNASNEYYTVCTDKEEIQKINTSDNAPMYDVILESAYNSQILTDPEYQSDWSATSTTNNTSGKCNRQVGHCRKDRDNPKDDPNTIIVLDNIDIHTQMHKNYTYKTTNDKNNKISSSSSSSNDSQTSDDAYSVYRYEQLDIEEHYLDDNEFGANDTLNASRNNTESYANIVSNTEYNISSKPEDSSMNGSFYSAKSSSTFNKSQQEDKNKYIIPMQMENGMCTPTSMSTLSTSSLLKSSNSNTSLMQQGSVKLSGSSSNKMKLKALMKSFFWRE